ncbi:hypothetical protein ACH3XW_27675 [Acanthocheilonema viteae]
MVMLRLCLLITFITTIQSTSLQVIGIIERKIYETEINELKMALNECCTECAKPHVSFPVSSIYIICKCYNDYMINSNRIVIFHLTKVNFTHEVCNGYLDNVEFNENTLQLSVNCCLTINNECSIFRSNDHSNKTSTYVIKIFVINYDFKFHLEEAARNVEKATRAMRSAWLVFGIILIILILLLLTDVFIKCRRYFKQANFNEPILPILYDNE